MAVFSEPVYEEPTLTPKMSKYEKVLAPLVETPDTWAKIGEYKNEDSAYQAALNLRHGRYRLIGEPSDWEFVPEGTEVFARYTKGSDKAKS